MSTETPLIGSGSPSPPKSTITTADGSNHTTAVESTVSTQTTLQSMFKGSSAHFKDQICTISQWFGQWNDCEQTVALYTLLRQLDSKQARFVENLLQEQASTDPAVDELENRANDLEFVHNLGTSKKPEEVIATLLTHFPLLHPGNDKVKDEYLKVIPKVLSNSVENSIKVEDCRKLLTYTLIHPAVSNDERSQFTKWLGQLERQYSKKITQTQMSHSNIQTLSSYAEQMDSTLTNGGGPHHARDNSGDVFCEVEVSSHRIPLHHTNSAPPYGSSLHAAVPNNNHKKLSRTSSCANHRGRGGDHSASPASSAGHWRSPVPAAHQNNVSDWVMRSHIGRASPSHSDHGPLSPQSSVSSTDSDQEAVVFYQENSGMKEFPAWLKSLRLHKYSHLFANVGYEEMLAIDDKWLEERKVTKGARNKLAQSISKLRERAADLRAMEQNVIQGANLKQVLTDLKTIACTPIKPFQAPESGPIGGIGDIADSDLPSLVNRLMGKLCTQLLVNSRVDDDCYPLYTHLIDKCMHHEAFNVKQRKLLQEWRAQVQQRNNGRMITGRVDQRPMAHRPTRPNQFYIMCRTSSWNNRRGSKGNAVYAQRAIQGQGHWTSATGYEKKPLSMTYSGPGHMMSESLGQGPMISGKPVITKPAIHRTQSAPLRAAAHPSLMKKSLVTEPEINERLDSLARSMTEAALSSQDSIDNHGDEEVETEQQ